MNNDIVEDINMTIGSDTEDINFEVDTNISVSSYNDLSDKPKINSVTLIGDKTSEDLGLQPAGNYLEEESDPVFTASASYGITSEDITNWDNKSDFSGSYNDLTDKPEIPDVSNFITKNVDDLTYYTKTSDLSAVATSGSYTDLSNKPTIPDVSNFITKDVNNLTYYTLKTSAGSYIDLSINTTTYVVTLDLKDIDGNVISTDSFDLPLESVVVNGYYDNNTKKVVLTLENGSTVDFSVADLVAGLQTEITSTNKLPSDYVDDTNSGNKFVTTSEKNTWNNKSDFSGNYNDLTNKPTIPDVSNFITKDVSNLTYYTLSTNLANVATSGSYNDLSNKPTIPSKLSDLTNDNNTVTDANYVHTDNNYTTAEKTKLSGLENYDDTKVNNKIEQNASYVNALPELTGSNTSVTLNNTANCGIKLELEPSELSQDDTPAPSDLQDVHVITGSNTITITNSDNTQSQNLPLTLGGLEYCKIGEYKDEFYKATSSDTELEEDKWYIKQNVRKKILNGTEAWNSSATYPGSFYGNYLIDSIGYSQLYCNAFERANVNSSGEIRANYRKNTTFIENIYGMIDIWYGDSSSDLQNFKNYCANNNVIIYYPTRTPLYTLLNDTLQEQLDNIYELAKSYQDQTNISQTNADLPFIIKYNAIIDITSTDINNWNSKQDALVSGTNIKTINNESLLGSGNINISGSGGSSTDVQINGTSITSSGTANIITEGTYNASSNKIATISDLPTVPTNVSAFTNDAGYLTQHQDISGKQDTLVSGTNIKTINNQSLLGSGNISISGGSGTATDVQINGTSIVSNDVANLEVAGTYSSLNKIATMSELPTDTNDLTNGAGYITGITSTDVTTALGYTPYNSTNPNGYTSNTGTITSIKMNGSTIASSGEANLGTVITSHQDITGKQNITDNTLTTINKTVPSAINEVNSIALGANQALSYANYSAMVTAFNALDDDVYHVGQNVMIVTLEVPDLWVSGIESTSSTYTYTTDSAITTALSTTGYIQVGYYKLSALETQKVDLTNYVQTSQLLNAIYPIGSIYISASSTSPATLFGGTWLAIGEGRTLIGAGTGTDSNSVSKTFAGGDTGGEYTHTLTIEEMPSHNHTLYYYNTSGSLSFGYNYGNKGAESKINNSGIGNTGEGQAHNIVQPYITVYMWKRTA